MKENFNFQHAKHSDIHRQKWSIKPITFLNFGVSNYSTKEIFQAVNIIAIFLLRKQAMSSLKNVIEEGNFNITSVINLCHHTF